MGSLTPVTHQDRLQLTRDLADKLKNQSDDSRVILNPTTLKADTQSYATRLTLEAVSSISPHVFENYTRDNIGTVEAFYRCFGQSRIEVISDRYHLPIPRLHQTGAVMTREQIQKLFVALADVRYEDVTDFLDQIRNGTATWISPDELHHLQKYIKKRPIEHLKRDEINLLIDYLSPFEKTEDIFLGTPPPEVINLDSGKRFPGRAERVFLIESLRQKAKLRKLIRSDYEYDLAKRIIDREPDEGTLLPSPDGFQVVHSRIIAGGAFILALKTIAGTALPTLVFRGTRPPLIATDGHLTLEDDLRVDVGSQGVMETFDAVQELLQDRNFLQNKRIELLGMSLGGAQAMVYQAMLGDFVARCVLVAPAGISPDITKWFEEDSKSYTRTVRIKYMMEDDDNTYQVGNLLYADHPKVELQINLYHPPNREKLEEMPTGGLFQFILTRNAHARRTIGLDGFNHDEHCDVLSMKHEETKRQIYQITHPTEDTERNTLYRQRLQVAEVLERRFPFFFQRMSDVKMIDFIKTHRIRDLTK